MRIKFIDKIINKKKKRDKEKIIYRNNNISIDKSIKKHLKLNIIGQNNEITINSINITGEINISICGNNNKIFIDENVKIKSALNILIGQDSPLFGETNNTSFTIGQNTSIEILNYTTFNSNCYCKIGAACIISFNVYLYNTDGHPIFEKGTRKIINRVQGIQIGNHCWLGYNSSILKNSILPNNSILGWNAVYSGKSDEEFCCFAGNPAKIVKHNADWDENAKETGYTENET